MKRLLLLRHAKAEAHQPPGSPLADHERALASRGRREARTMGRLLALANSVPGLSITSSATRCVETVELAGKAGKWKTPVVAVDALYGGGPSAYLAAAREAPDEHGVILVCGHEPTLSELAAQLAGGSVRVPPGTVIGLDFAAERWREVAFDGGELVFLLPPRLFTEGEFDFAED